MAEVVFSMLSDDIILNIFLNLEDDPRHWARLACVCTKFSSLIRDVCWKNKCLQTIPSVVSDLLSDSSSPPGGWASLHKLAVCCPGILHAGVLLESSDFGLERELGPDENYQRLFSPPTTRESPEICLNHTDTKLNADGSEPGPQFSEEVKKDVVNVGGEFSSCKKGKFCRPLRSHLASGIWNLSREEGNKLLARQFRDDCLYICDWPGCKHIEEKRNYMLFRGVFKDFKRSRLLRTINDGNRRKTDLNCAFCLCKETWDLHSAFCLRRGFGYHDDGEPVVRAYVCENGHVSGAWTDLPLYT